jgi:general secretion pathway protein D
MMSENRKNSTKVRLLIWLIALLLLLPVMPAFANSKHDQFNQPMGEIDFREATVESAARVLSNLSGANIVVTKAAGAELFSLYLSNTTVRAAIDSICRVNGLWYRYNEDTDVFIVMTVDEYKKDLVVFRDEQTRIFTLKYQNVVKVAETIEALFGDGRVKLTVDTTHGDDFELKALADLVDDGGNNNNNNNSNNNNSSNNNQRNGSTTNENGVTIQGVNDPDSELTAAQLALLAGVVGNRGTQVNETAVQDIVQRELATIYVTINRSHNLLYVRTGDREAMQEIARIVRRSDRPGTQVLLEMKVLQVKVTDGFHSSFDFSISSGENTSGPVDGQQINPLAAGASSVSKSILGLGNHSLEASNTMVFQLMDDRIRMRLQLLEEAGNVEVLATPMLLSTNNRASQVFVGEETVITTGFSGGGVVVGDGTAVTAQLRAETEVRAVGNRLLILPSINADRTVLMRVVHENSTVVPDGAKVPIVSGSSFSEVPVDTISTTTLEGMAMGKDGMTIAIGGMFTETRTDTEDKVPILGDLPLLGALFKRVEKSSVKNELILLITPHVFNTPEEAEAAARSRVGELSVHPNSVDVFLDRRKQERSKTATGRKVNKVIREKATQDHNLNDDLITLTRFAAEAIHLSQSMEPKSETIYPVSLGQFSPVPLFPGVGVEAFPVRSWRMGTLYVTAVGLRNRTTKKLYLNPNEVSGNWLSATLETEELAPAGGVGDTTNAFLVSSVPFIGAVP